MATAAPKSFTQIRFFAQFVAVYLGYATGLDQRYTNKERWDEHFRQQWKAKQIEIESRDAYEKSLLPKPAIPESMPEELHEIYQTLTSL